MTKSIHEDAISELVNHTKEATAVVNENIQDESHKRNYFQVFSRNEKEILLIAAIPALNDSDKFKLDRLLGAEQIKDTIINTTELYKLNALLEMKVLKINPFGRRDCPALEFHHERLPNKFITIASIESQKPSSLLSDKTEFWSYQAARGIRHDTPKSALFEAQKYVQAVVNEWKAQSKLEQEAPNKSLQKMKA